MKSVSNSSLAPKFYNEHGTSSFSSFVYCLSLFLNPYIPYEPRLP